MRAVILFLLAFLLLPVAVVGAVEHGEGAEAELTREERLDALFVELGQSDAAGAEEIAMRIREIWSDSGSASMNLIFIRASIAMEAGNLAAALEHLDNLVALAPEFAEGWNARATVHYYRRDYEQSLRDIHETLAREARHFGALSGLGLVFLALGNKGAALSAFESALALHPHLPGPTRMVEQLREEMIDESI